MSTSYLTITTSSQIFTSLPSPKATDEVPTTVRTERAPIRTAWEQPQYDRRHVAPLFIIIIVVGGLLLSGCLIGLYLWRRSAKRKEREYPGHQVLGMLGRSSRNANASPAGGAAQSGYGGAVTEMRAGVSSTNATRASGGMARTASSSAPVPAAVPVVGRIDGVLAGEMSGAGKASGGDGGMARYA